MLPDPKPGSGAKAPKGWRPRCSLKCAGAALCGWLLSGAVRLSWRSNCWRIKGGGPSYGDSRGSTLAGFRRRR